MVGSKESEGSLEEPSQPGEITALLVKWSGGDRHALDELVPLVYQQLRKAASGYLQREPSDHTLQTEALVNEVYLQLAKSKRVRFANREQFFFFAGQIMRHILVQYARNRLALKRGGNQSRVPLEEVICLSNGQVLEFSDLLSLDKALIGLEAIDRRQSLIIELRFFAGMSNEEIGQALKISLATVKRDWKTAKLWLSRSMIQQRRE